MLASNILFSLSSVRDYTIIPPQLIKCEDGDELKICLFHGRVNGALLFNGTTIEGEITKNNKKTITPSNFLDYDLALLGDIHKFQYLNKDKTMAYAGSLIYHTIKHLKTTLIGTNVSTVGAISKK